MPEPGQSEGETRFFVSNYYLLRRLANPSLASITELTRSQSLKRTDDHSGINSHKLTFNV